MATYHPQINKIRFEKTFVMIKPDGVKRGLIGECLKRFESRGLKIVALKMINATKWQIERHYPMSDDAWVTRLGVKTKSGFEALGLDVKELLGTDDNKILGNGVKNGLYEYMTSGPVVAMIIEGVSAADMVRKLVGATLPFKAELGSIRGDFSVDSPLIANSANRSVHNIIHASENVAEAEKEIDIWFTSEEIRQYELAHEAVMFDKSY